MSSVPDNSDSSELGDWHSLAAEADRQSPEWRKVMVAALSVYAGTLPETEAIEQHLNHMVMSIHQGQIQSYIPFDRQGQTMRFAKGIHPARRLDLSFMTLCLGKRRFSARKI